MRPSVSVVLLACSAGLCGCAQHDMFTPEYVKVSSGVMAGQLIKRVPPQHACEYEAGSVITAVLIDPTGRVAEVSKILGPEKKFEAFADAIRQWEYRPYLVDGVATPVHTIITMSISCGT